LRQGEHERQVAVDAVLALEDVSSFDIFPRGSELDEDTRFVDGNGFVELQ